MSQNLPQLLMLNTKHVLAYVSLSACSYLFDSLKFTLYSEFGLRSLGTRGTRHTGCQALCWRLP